MHLLYATVVAGLVDIVTVACDIVLPDHVNGYREFTLIQYRDGCIKF